MAVFLAGFSLYCVMPASAQIQSTVKELREGAFRKFGLGEFESAIPDLLMLINALKNVKTQSGKAELDVLYYNLGIAYFLTGQFTQSHKAFTNYCKKYPHSTRTHKAYVYIADGLRFTSKNEKAIRAYKVALSKFSYHPDLRTDIYAGIACCYLAMDDWEAVQKPLHEAFRSAPDFMRRNRAATLLVTAFLKTQKFESLYPIIPYLLKRDSQASRSIVFNLSAMEAGDDLFGDERYREALWIYRLVFPYEQVQISTEKYLEQLKQKSEYEKKKMTDPRRLMRIMEWIGDAESELKMIEGIENYDKDLFYRIARGYKEALRYREACDAFLHLHNVDEAERAEESLYLAFVCASRITPHKRCFKIARQYMDEYPAGRYYDELTLLTGQMYANAKRWNDVILHFSDVLRVRPGHQMAAECLFLLGYAHFMEEQFEQTTARLRELRKRFPGWEQIDAAIYWTAMSLMFAADYEAADKDFTLLLKNGGSSEYIEDGSYRRAVCSYALAQYELAETRLAEFMTTYPKGSLRYEAMMVRGDIAGAVGRTDDAVRFYQLALTTPDDLMNIEFYNHCAFKAGEIIYDGEKFDEVRSHFNTYIKRNREGSNIPLAVYWSGKALFNVGEEVGALRYYQNAAAKYGKDRKAMGVDLILDEWVGTTRRLGSNDVEQVWSEMVGAWKNAVAQGDEVARLRYQRILMYRPGNKASLNHKILTGLLQEENLKYASPAVMEMMLDETRKQKNTPFAVVIAKKILKEYTETDFALDARLYLARINLEKARNSSFEKAKILNQEAMEHLNIIREVYATSGEATEALLLLGTLYRDQRKYDEALECFNSVLGVKAWRSAWPEALYGLGLCAEARKDRLKATAYYERIYVMYSNYRKWAAKAYLSRAKCLSTIYRNKEAKETLDEMLAQKELIEFPEYAQAKKLRSKMGGR